MWDKWGSSTNEVYLLIIDIFGIFIYFDAGIYIFFIIPKYILVIDINKAYTNRI